MPNSVDFTLAREPYCILMTLVLQAIDADNDPVTYSILNGNVGNQWAINPVTGEITATREVDYEATPGGQGL